MPTRLLLLLALLLPGPGVSDRGSVGWGTARGGLGSEPGAWRRWRPEAPLAPAEARAGRSRRRRAGSEHLRAGLSGGRGRPGRAARLPRGLAGQRRCHGQRLLGPRALPHNFTSPGDTLGPLEGRGRLGGRLTCRTLPTGGRRLCLMVAAGQGWKGLYNRGGGNVLRL